MQEFDGSQISDRHKNMGMLKENDHAKVGHLFSFFKELIDIQREIKSGDDYAGILRDHGVPGVRVGQLIAPESAQVPQLIDEMLRFINDRGNLQKIHIIELAVYAQFWLVSNSGRFDTTG